LNFLMVRFLDPQRSFILSGPTLQPKRFWLMQGSILSPTAPCMWWRPAYNGMLPCIPRAPFTMLLPLWYVCLSTVDHTYFMGTTTLSHASISSPQEIDLLLLETTTSWLMWWLCSPSTVCWFAY
jgi:hypothetical protein